MNKLKNVLLASHGTEGARAAERMALALCPRGCRLYHLIVVPEFWKGMMGDDWLNNVSTRMVYAKYIESTLEAEVAREVRRFSREARKRGLRYEAEMAFGKPTECLLARLKRSSPDLVIMGALRPKKRTGLRSRMLTDDVLRAVKVPLIIAPYPI
jgi:nucleotide-binding universal stress UspA family protein